MKPAIQEVSRDTVKDHPIMHTIRDAETWGSLHEALIRVDTAKAAWNLIWERNTTGEEND